MAAVLGGDADEVLAAIEAAGLYPANRNGAGPDRRRRLDRPAWRSSPPTPPAKARVIALQVAGAFHTPYMAPAEQALAAVAGGITPADPHQDPAVQRWTAPPSAAAATVLRRLVRQVTAPVRWDLCMATLADLGVTARHRAAAGRHPRRAGQARAQGRRDRHRQHAGRPGRRPRPDRPARRGAQPEPTLQFRVVVAAVGRQLRARRATSPRAPTIGRPGDRPRQHPAGPGRRGRARRGRTHRMARPPRRPGRPGPAPRPHRRSTSHERRHRKILAVGHYQPARVLTNDDLAQMVDTNDEWIRDRVGIATRRIADSETVADMAAAAAGKALAASGLTAADIDLVVVATCSSVDRCPNVATRVAAKLGIARAGRLRHQHRLLRLLLRAGHRRPRDPGRRRPQRPRRSARRSSPTSPTGPTGRPASLRRRGRRGRGHRDRRGRAARHRPGACGARRPDKSDVITIEGWRPYIEQDGQTVFRWATTALPPLARAGLRGGRHTTRPTSPRSSPHQANLRIIEPLARKLGRRRRGHRQGHRRVRQHVRGERPAGPVQAGRAPRGALRRTRCCCSASAAASPTPGRSSAARNAHHRRTTPNHQTREGNHHP